jgi:hypothetical protein
LIPTTDRRTRARIRRSFARGLVRRWCRGACARQRRLLMWQHL